jgi:uncharacterized protein (DUF2236 family)
MTYRNPNIQEFAYVHLDSSIFSDSSIIRRCHGVWGIATGIGIRALLVQALHPVALTGLLLSNPKLLQEPTARIMRTLLAMETVYWGTWREAIALTNHIGEMHARVHGKVGAAGGSIPANTSYSALDSRVQKWIIASLIDATIACHNIFVSTPLTDAEMDQLVREYGVVGALFGVRPRDRWSSYADFLDYFTEMIFTMKFSSFSEYADAMKLRIGPDFQADPRMFLELTEANRLLVLNQTLHPDNALADIFRSDWATFVSGILTADLRRIYKLKWTETEAGKFLCMVQMAKIALQKAQFTQVGSAIWTMGAILNPCVWWTIPCAVAAGELSGKMTHGPILYRRNGARQPGRRW